MYYMNSKKYRAKAQFLFVRVFVGNRCNLFGTRLYLGCLYDSCKFGGELPWSDS